jgi:hypothetical protein
MNTVRKPERQVAEAVMTPLAYAILLVFGSIALGGQLISCILWAALSAMGFNPLQEDE